MNAWWESKSSDFPRFTQDQEFRLQIEDMSGRNPLLLRGVAKAFVGYLSSKSGNLKVVHCYSESEDTDNKVVGAASGKGKGIAGAMDDINPEDIVIDEDAQDRADVWSYIYNTEEWARCRNRIIEFALDSIMGKDESSKNV